MTAFNVSLAEEIPLRWGADAEGGAPFIYLDPQQPNRTTGFEVELVDAISKELHRPIHFRQYNFESLFSGLERGDIDFAMNGLEVNQSRSAQVRFSRPYYLYSLQLSARRNEQRFLSIQDLKQLGGTVGTLGETASSRWLARENITAKLYDGQAEPYQDLMLGRIDAVLLDLPVAIYYSQPHPELKFVGEPFAHGGYAAIFPRDQEAQAKKFDAAILKLAEQGTLKQIYEKYGIWNEFQTVLTDPLPLQSLARMEQNHLLPNSGDSPPPLGNPRQDSAQKFRFRDYFPLLVRSAGVTILVSILSMCLAVLVALPISIARLYGPLPLRVAAICYVEFFRGIPVLLLLYMLYYGLPTMMQQLCPEYTIALPPFVAAILAFGLNYAAYEAEIYRSALRSIPVGQWEAAASLGLSPQQTFRRIILPQAIRMIIPPMTNDFVALFKETSLISVIAVVELTKQYQMLAKSSLKYMEIGLATAGLYLLMSIPLGHLARRLEERAEQG